MSIVIFHGNISWQVVFVTAAPIHSFSSFGIEITTKIALSICENSGIDMCSDKKVPDLGYVDDVLLD